MSMTRDSREFWALLAALNLTALSTGSCGGGVVGPSPSTEPVTTCTPTTCAASQKDCGSLADGCDGVLSCGNCASGSSCSGGGVANVCGSGSVCTAESDVAFCRRLNKSCGELVAQDNCGTPRTVASCGDCVSAAPCTPQNVCGGAPISGCKSTLSGSLSTQTLVEADSPFCVTADLVVPVGERLTIEPGVLIDFQGHYSMTIRGHLTAIGTEAQRITFTSSKNENWPSTSGANRGWNGLRFYPYQTPAEIDDDWVEYCTFSFANKSGNDESDGVATYVDSTGGAVYLAGRPATMSGPLESVTPRFHFNHNILDHNAVARSGGGFHLIQEICMNPGDGASCGSEGYFTMEFEDNHFESNRCNLIGSDYGAGAWSQFHCGVWQRSELVIKGGAFVNNGCEPGQGDATSTQAGGADGTVIFQDVSVSPTAGWLWDYNADIQLLGTTPSP